MLITRKNVLDLVAKGKVPITKEINMYEKRQEETSEHLTEDRIEK